MPKVKFIQDMYSSLGTFNEGETYDLDFDPYILDNWKENGFLEYVKDPKLVKKNETKPSTNK